MQQKRYLYRTDDHGSHHRSLNEAQARYNLWRQDERYAALAPLRRALTHIPPERFVHLSQFLRHPSWEATNNGAERAGRIRPGRQRTMGRSGPAWEATNNGAERAGRGFRHRL